MGMWRCPHCGIPQPEAARCWVCHRSSTSCGTCRHFRRAIAGGLGYCGLDRRRSPLHGDELRGCWEWPVTSGPAGASGDPPAPGDRTPVRARRDFVPLEAPLAVTARAEAAPDEPAGTGGRRATGASPGVGWALFPEIEA